MRWVWAAVLASVAVCGCLDDPTFVQADAGGDAGTSSSGGEPADGGPTPTPTTTTTATTPPPPSNCGPACAIAGGTCEGSTCAFRCPVSPPASPAQMMACTNAIVCPPGTSCLVACSAKNACKKITCNESSNDCDVTCGGDTACSDQVTIASSNGTLSCSGNNACPKVDCEGSKCAVTCGGNACSANNVKCCAKSCTVNNAPGTCKN